MLTENSGRLDQKLDSWHLIASQMQAQPIPFYTNPSVVWALATPNLLPAQPRDRPSHTLPSSLLYNEGCRSLLPSLSLECTKERDTIWFKCNSKSVCEIQGQKKQGACGTQQPLYFSPQKRAWHNSYNLLRDSGHVFKKQKYEHLI